MSNKSVIENIKERIAALQDDLKRWESMPETVSIHYSADRAYYYVNDTEQDRPQYWMSVGRVFKPETIPNGPFSASYLQIKRTDIDDEYWKQILPFNFWKVKSGDIEPIARDSDLYKDYASLMQWKELSAA